MASLWKKLAGLSTDLLGLGAGGVAKALLKLPASGVLEVRTPNDAALAQVRAASPLGPNDVVTRAYLQLAIAGSTQWKAAVRVATTGSVVLAGLQVIDGVALAEGDRVLAWLQANGAENGIYLASAGGWVRAPDGPGLGVDVDEAVVARYRITEADLG